MDAGTLRRRIFDLGVVTAFAAIAFMTSVAIGNGATISGEEANTAQTLPSVAASSTDCTTELAAYATALSNLEAAQDAAEQAYHGWYRCEFGQDPEPIPVVESPTNYQLPMFSVLDR